MGAQSSATIYLQLSVNATNWEDTLQYTSTISAYAADALAISSSVWAYLYKIQNNVAATPSTTVKFINGLVRINNVTAPRTPYGYYTSWSSPGGGNPGVQAVTAQEANYFRWNFILGPSDFTDQPSLGAALSAQIAQAIAFTPNYS